LAKPGKIEEAAIAGLSIDVPEHRKVSRSGKARGFRFLNFPEPCTVSQASMQTHGIAAEYEDFV
jgi:hypothetical protein